jgi:HD superfamily phosphohydrolase
MSGTPTEQLLAVCRTVSVWSGHDHAMTVAEEMILSTRIMQRLRRLRQVGLFHHAAPVSENTRYSHSIGCSYWSVRMLAGLLAAEETEQGEAIGELIRKTDRRISLEYRELSLELLIRVFALVHDVALLPFGHTLRFQLSLIHEPDTFSRSFQTCIEGIIEEINSASRSPADIALAKQLGTYLRLAEAVAHIPRLLGGREVSLLIDEEYPREKLHQFFPALTLVYDIVHGVYSADIIDVYIRDFFSIGRSWELPAILLQSGRTVKAHPGSAGWPVNGQQNPLKIPFVYRYAFSIGEKDNIDIATVTALGSALMTRYELAEQIFYHPRKGIADAMLDKSIRLASQPPGATPGEKFQLSDSVLLRMGDDEFLDRLEGLEKHAAEPEAGTVAGELIAGRLYETAFFTRIGISKAAYRFDFDQLQRPAERTLFEQRAASELGLSSEIGLIVGVLPSGMQSKRAEALIQIGCDETMPICELADKTGMVPEILSLEERYRRLRSAAVYCSRDTFARCPDIKDRMVDFFQRGSFQN